MQKNYHLDTCILMENENVIEILRNGNENDISISMTVLEELDGLLKDTQKRPRALKAVQSIYENKDYITFTGDKNQILNNDDKILKSIMRDGRDDPVFVTNDLMLRLKSYIHNIESEEFKESKPFESESQKYTGFIEYYTEEKIPNCFYFKEGKLHQHTSKKERIIDYSHDSIWKVRARDVYQNAAFDLLMNEDIDLVTIQSEAGHGKSYLSLAAAFTNVFQLKRHKRVVVIKYPVEIGIRQGFLPGSIDEKMSPHWNPLYKLILKLHEGRNLPDKCFLDNKDAALPQLNPRFVEFMPINYLRGDNIDDAFVIISEAQNIPRSDMKSILTRMGNNVKCVCEGDTSQVDNPVCNEQNNGLNWLVKLMKGKDNYGHVLLNGKRTRGPICDMVLNSGL